MLRVFQADIPNKNMIDFLRRHRSSVNPGLSMTARILSWVSTWD